MQKAKNINFHLILYHFLSLNSSYFLLIKYINIIQQGNSKIVSSLRPFSAEKIVFFISLLNFKIF